MIQPAPVDPPELDTVLWSGFPSGEVGFDVGANCGQTFNKILEMTQRLVAFEPAEEAFEFLQSHYGRRHDIELADVAVSNRDGEVDLVAAPSKISTGQLVTHGTHGMEWSEDEMHNGVVRTLRSVTLDTYVRDSGVWPDFIKVDVEGHEVAVLEGARGVLEGSAPHLLIEIHSESLGEAIVEMLQDSYRLEIVRHPHYAEGTTLWKSHFWIRGFPNK